MQDIWGAFMDWFAVTFALFKEPPFAPFFITLVSLSISTVIPVVPMTMALPLGTAD